MNYPLSLRHQVFGQGLATGSAFIWLMFFSTLAHCQQISVLVIPEQGTFLADNVELRVVLSNASKDQQVALEDVTIMPIGVLQVLYKSTPVTFATSSSGGIVVPPGGSADGRVTLVPNADWSRRLVSLALLPSREYSFQLSYKPVNDSVQPAQVRTTGVLLTAHPLTVFVGGVVGAFLLALFRTFRRYLNVADVLVTKPPADWSASQVWINEKLWRVLRTCWLMALKLIYGGVIAVILLLVAENTKLSLPISIQVSGFVGGVLVGLFSIPLGDWLAKNLGLSEKTN